mgnify:CR=1 FL=1
MIIFILGNVISEDPVCDPLNFPSSLKQYSAKLSTTVSNEITFQVYSSPHKNFEEIPNAEEKTDPVIRLVSSVLRLSCLCQKFIEVKIGNFKLFIFGDHVRYDVIITFKYLYFSSISQS